MQTTIRPRGTKGDCGGTWNVGAGLGACVVGRAVGACVVGRAAGAEVGRTVGAAVGLSVFVLHAVVGLCGATVWYIESLVDLRGSCCA